MKEKEKATGQSVAFLSTREQLKVTLNMENAICVCVHVCVCIYIYNFLMDYP